MRLGAADAGVGRAGAALEGMFGYLSTGTGAVCDLSGTVRSLCQLALEGSETERQSFLWPFGRRPSAELEAGGCVDLLPKWGR